MKAGATKVRTVRTDNCQEALVIKLGKYSTSLAVLTLALLVSPALSQQSTAVDR
jgi:hypothetical protein